MCRLTRYEFCTETAGFRNTKANREQSIVRCAEWDEILSNFKTRKGEDYARARQRLKDHVAEMEGNVKIELVHIGKVMPDGACNPPATPYHVHVPDLRGQRKPDRRSRSQGGRAKPTGDSPNRDLYFLRCDGSWRNYMGEREKSVDFADATPETLRRDFSW